jgi:hypothetical protein
VGGASGASAGGSSTGGSGGGECDLPVEILPEYTIASPEALNDRLAIFLYGVRGARFEPLPEAADVSWVRSIVSRVLEEQFDEDGRAPEGLENFWLGWAFDHQGDANKAFWGSFFARGNFADLFRSVDGRVSFMSDPYFLRSHPDSTYRGTWMARYLFGFDVPPPPFEIERVTASSGKTRRQTVEEAVSGDACIGCHVHFDPLGFSLEHYDEYGDYRDVENGLTIDASGTYSQASVQLEFSSIDDLAGQLPALCEVQASFARAFFEHAILIAGFPADAYEPVELRYVTREFREGDLALAPLVLAAASTPAFLRAE